MSKYTASVLMILALGLSACTGSNSENNGERKQAYSGSLSQRMNEIYRNFHQYSDCDVTQKDIRLEIAEVLDSNRGGIEQFRAKSQGSSDSRYDLLQIGQFKVQKLRGSYDAQDSWQTFSETWDEVIAYYRQIKSLPIGKEWLSLDSWVRGIIVDDYDRIVEKADYSLTRATTKKNFRKRNHEVDPATRTIFVRMQGDKLGNEHAEFEKYSAEVWSKDGLQVKMKWTNEQSAFLLFLMNIIENGERAFVGPDSINLPERTKATTIAHEFGHVLGLRDEYYVSWSPQTCGYSMEINEGNIMSVSETGRILPYHIEQILKQYF